MTSNVLSNPDRGLAREDSPTQAIGDQNGHGVPTLVARQSDKNIKILVAGDSITQGAEGDYTWRWRLLSWLQSDGTATKVTFVGPYPGTQNPDPPQDPQPPLFYGQTPPATPPRVTGGYATAVPTAFIPENNHLALWGRQVAQVVPEIGGVVEKYKPDYLLVALGFNDMGWLVSDWAGTLTSIRSIVANARQANSNLRIVLATVPNRTFIRQDLVDNTTRYNNEIRNVVAALSTPTSPITLAEFAKEYACGPTGDCPAAYDGLHPNALGEWQIAKAFSDALVKHGLRTKGITVPTIIDEPTVLTPQIVAESAPWGVNVTWDKVYGSRGYDTRSRVKGSMTWSEGVSNTNRMHITFTAAGVDWEFQVRASRGAADKYKSAWSDVKTATATKSGAPGPKGIQAAPKNGGVTVTWSPPDGSWAVQQYEVIVLDKDIPGAYIQAWSFGTNGAAFITGLVNGHKYDLWIATWATINGQLVRGDPTGGPGFTPGSGAVGVPSGLKVTTKDATTVDLGWAAVTGASGYKVYLRNINDGSAYSTDGGVIQGTSHGMAFLFPGVWNFEFCVSTLVGSAESAKSPCIAAQRPA
ncbi:SGNH hydrolase-type esterase domain-containing protein [Elsinoe ampelina]|uniref:SGNH hydrolase-type esterase domain-containing protein n=1 Tax=Elsinoe ampelina TaxID=302913 RepID=A0A6A6G1Z9_9PEZI|nr:SGNH hydrolase-type esterase domain-containing protein [Elsinoe ampelina]